MGLIQVWISWSSRKEILGFCLSLVEVVGLHVRMPTELNGGGGKRLGDQSQHTSEVWMRAWDSPDGPLVKTPCSRCRECEFSPWCGDLSSSLMHDMPLSPHKREEKKY